MGKAISIRSGQGTTSSTPANAGDFAGMARFLELSPPLLAALLASVAGLTLVSYAAYSWFTVGELGFPLDDSWIYQQFARNLSRYGTLVYNPGVPASGATSLLWVPLLAVAYLLQIEPVLWTFLLGGVALFALALASYHASLALFPERRVVAIAASLVVATDWRMAWSAMSGMETTVFTLLTILLIWAVVGRSNPFLTGAIGGLLVATRPEGLLLAGAVIGLSLIGLIRERRSCRLHESLRLFAGIGLVIIPYFAAGYLLTGNWLPNTFHAKQALYAEAATPPGRIVYLFDAARVVLFGPSASVIFALGGLVAAWKLLASRNLLLCLPIIWVVSLLMVYAIRMPITLQHGRYVMPLVPVAIILSVAGTSDLLDIARRHSFNVLPTVFPLIALVAIIASWAIGAKILAADVEIINSQHVETARWIERNTDEGSVVATHDIGALAYFSNRKIVDTVGLTDPDFIPYIHDRQNMVALARDKGAEYFAFLPDWYYDLPDDTLVEKVYEASGDGFRRLGYRNMVVYRFGLGP